MEKNLYEYDFIPSKLDKLSYRKTAEDSRIKVSDEKINSLPYSAIGLLKVLYPHDIISYRTGVLISENIVLTAGHNLFDPRRNPNANNEVLGSPVNIEFYPGLNNNKSYFKKCECKKFYFNDINKDDYGIIVLKENIGKITGYFELKIFEKNKDMNNIFYNSGYPLNKTTGNNNIFHLYEDKGKILNIEKNSIVISRIKSSYGQSGAGLFFCKDKKYYVIGVHVASSLDDELFYAILINQERYEQINKCINEDKNS